LKGARSAETFVRYYVVVDFLCIVVDIPSDVTRNPCAHKPSRAPQSNLQIHFDINRRRG
jgi:hypothetical protein